MNNRIPETPPVIHPIPDGVARSLWSVMIPVYNCFEYIRVAVESVLKQDPGEQAMQIEVIDDCSTDGDVEALVKEIGAGRVGYYRQPVNRGSLRNFETAIQRSRGERVHLLHGDDLVKPGFYEEIDKLFCANPGIGAAFTKCTHVDENGVEAAPWHISLLQEPGIIPGFLEQAAVAPILQPPSIVVKREVYEKLGSFYGVHYGEDWEMWIRIAANYSVAYSPRCLALYRSGHAANITSRSIATGQNILDIKKVIRLAQNSIPLPLRRKLKARASKNFSIHYAMASNRIYHTDKKGAFIQAHGALGLSSNLKSIYYVVRLYLLHLRKTIFK
ncbi:MAG: glycosyltransferase [Chitinophagaceae bacterium]